MLKKYVALLFTLGFFAILPSAVAEDQTTITHDAPANVRLPQTTHNPITLLTLHANNIQVQEQWTVHSNHPLTISNDGKLKIDGDIEGVTQILATVVLQDLFNKLNNNYTNLSVHITITIDIISNSSLADAPPLYALFGASVSLHTFTLTTDQTGAITYSLVNNTLFGIDDNGIFSSFGMASIGLHTLTIQASVNAFSTQAVAIVEIVPTLSLPDAPTLFANIGDTTALYTFTANGGILTKTYALQTATPNYFSFNETNGVLSLADQATIGVYILTIRATDRGDNSITTYATVQIINPLTLVTPPPINHITGAMLSLYTFIAEGGFGDKIYTIIAGDNAFILRDAILSVSVNIAVGVYPLTIAVADRAIPPNRIIASVTVEIFPPLSFPNAPTSLLANVDNTTALHTFTVVGGINKKTYTLQTAADYFVLDSNHGILSLTNQATVGVYLLTIYATDEQNNTTATYVTVQLFPALSLDDAPLLLAYFDTTLSLHTFTVAGGINKKTYTLQTATPEYFGLDSNHGVLSLTHSPTPGGTYLLTIRAIDQGHNHIDAYATVQIITPLVLVDPSLIKGNTGTMLSLHTFMTEGGYGDKTYTIIAGHDAFIMHNAILSVSANIAIGVYSLTLAITDQPISSDSLPYRITASVTVQIFPVLSITKAPALTVSYGTTLSLYTFTATDGAGSKIYRLLTATPDYFSLDENDGVLSLANHQASIGVYILTIRATDEGNSYIDAYATVYITGFILAEVPFIYAPSGVSVALYTMAVMTERTTPITYSLLGNPALFSIDQNGIFSSDRMALAGRYTLTIQAQTSTLTARTVATVELFPTLSLANIPPQFVKIGENIPLKVVATGGVKPIRYKLQTASPSNYFRLNDFTGILSYSTKNASPGTHLVTISITDQADNTLKTVATIYLIHPLTLPNHPPRLEEPAGAMSSLYTFMPEDGFGDKTYTIIDGDAAFVVPNGILSVNVNIAAGVYSLTIAIADSAIPPNRITTLVTVEIFPALSLPNAPYLLAKVGETNLNLHTFTADGGIRNKTYTLQTASPNYFSLNENTGVLSLSDSQNTAGVYFLTIIARDNGGHPIDTVATVQIVAPLILPNTPNMIHINKTTEADVNLTTFAPEGGYGDKTYTIVAGDGQFMMSDNILVAQANVSSGSYTLSIEIYDNYDHSASVVVVVDVPAYLFLAMVPAINITAESVPTSPLHTLSATGGGDNKTYTIVSGNTNTGGYFSLDSNHALVVNTNVAVQSYMLSLEVRDQYDNRAGILVMVNVEGLIFLTSVPSSPIIIEAGPAVNNLHTFSSTGVGDATYEIVAGDDSKHFTLGNNGVLGVKADAAPNPYILQIEVRNQYGSKDEAEVVVDVRLSEVQGTNVFGHKDDNDFINTHFRFPRSGLSNDNLNDNYYIHYRGRYFEPVTFWGEDTAETYIPIDYDESGNDNFKMIHKSVIDGTDQAGYITNIVKSYLFSEGTGSKDKEFIYLYNYNQRGIRYVQFAGSPNIVSLSGGLVATFNCGGTPIRWSSRTYSGAPTYVNLHEELLGGVLTKSLLGDIIFNACVKPGFSEEVYYWALVSKENPSPDE